MVRDRFLASSVAARSRPADGEAAADRASTGIPHLDAAIGGGFPRNRAVVLCGAAGTGKTTFGLEFLLDGLAAGEPGIFVTADEKPRHLLEDAARFEWDLEPPMARGVLTVLDAAPFHTASRGRHGHLPGIDARQVASDLVEEVSRIGARRLVVDSITSLVPPDMTRGAAHDYLRCLIQSLEDNAGCTTLLTCRGAASDPQGSCHAARGLATGVLELRLARSRGGFTRTLRVRKMRATAIEPVEFQFHMAPGWGLVLAEQPHVGVLAS